MTTTGTKRRAKPKSHYTHRDTMEYVFSGTWLAFNASYDYVQNESEKSYANR